MGKTLIGLRSDEDTVFNNGEAIGGQAHAALSTCSIPSP